MTQPNCPVHRLLLALETAQDCKADWESAEIWLEEVTASGTEEHISEAKARLIVRRTAYDLAREALLEDMLVGMERACRDYVDTPDD